MPVVVVLQMTGKLQPQRRFARPFLAKDNRRRRLRRVAKNFVPRWVVRALDAEFFENWVSLRVFFRKRIASDAVMFEKLLDFHCVRSRFKATRMAVKCSVSSLQP